MEENVHGPGPDASDAEFEEENHPPRKRRWRPRQALWVVAVLILIAAVWFFWQRFGTRISTDDAQIDGHISPISARVGGTILKVFVNDNQLVQPGTMLVQIDPRDYRVALSQAQANLAAAISIAEAAQTGVPLESTTRETQVNTTRDQVRQAEAAATAAEKDVDAARARLESAQARERESQANFVKAAQDVDRYKLLVTKDEVSRQQYDAAVAAMEATRAQRDSNAALVNEAARAIAAAESRVIQARTVVSQAQSLANQAASTAPGQLQITRAQAGTAEARVQQARAAVEEAQLRLEYATILAPIAGWVSNKTVQVGQIVQPGQGILSIIPLEDIWVTANFKETQLKQIRPGQPAEIHVDAFGRDFHGHVESIAAATGERFSLLPPENASGNYVKVVQRIPVKITIDKGQDPEHLLRIGLSVTPTIIIR